MFCVIASLMILGNEVMDVAVLYVGLPEYDQMCNWDKWYVILGEYTDFDDWFVLGGIITFSLHHWNAQD